MDHSVTDHCYINVPYPRLVQDFDLVVRHRINPEIGLEGDFLYTTPRDDYVETAKRLQAAGLSCTLHAPFFDMAPGALDRGVRQATRTKLKLAFSLIEVFRPCSIVCHLNYDAERYGYDDSAWFDHALATFRELLAMAESQGTLMMLENTYETGPDLHLRLFEALASPHARFCFDCGHTLAFAKTGWQEWFPAMAPYLGQLHVHDNAGGRDDHLPPGEGKFDFAGFFAYLEREGLAPIVTLEPHSEENLWKSLDALSSLGLDRHLARFQQRRWGTPSTSVNNSHGHRP